MGVDFLKDRKRAGQRTAKKAGGQRRESVRKSTTTTHVEAARDTEAQRSDVLHAAHHRASPPDRPVPALITVRDPVNITH
jgi:hypothetical protein